ncbi:metallophosphoesterase [Loktanella agnita]|uniref:metallophosphoesterase n=1 Tax=Loktanella agnita TaxID=287097 RepID=UPI0039858800
MTKIIWMTDPHYQSAGDIAGLNPRVRLATAIDHMNTHHGDAALAVISGDLVGDDIGNDYAGLSTYLARSNVSIHALVGNNDDRAGFRAHLPLPEDAMPDFVQYVLTVAGARLICLDTHKPGSHAGEFCATRQDWLKQMLLQQPDLPTYIFMHHPPMALGLPKQDEIRLENGDAFLDLISGYPNVRHLFIGHVHRPTCGTIRGIPFVTLGALSFQAPAPQPDWDWQSFKAAEEPPHYAVLSIQNGDITVQFTQYCTYAHGMEAAPQA